MSERRKNPGPPFYIAGAVLATAYLAARIGEGSDMLMRVSATLFLLWSAALVFMTIRSKRGNK